MYGFGLPGACDDCAGTNCCEELAGCLEDTTCLELNSCLSGAGNMCLALMGSEFDACVMENCAGSASALPLFNAGTACGQTYCASECGF